MDQVRSLNIEHVSFAALMQQEISRRNRSGLPAGQGNQCLLVTDEIGLAFMRRWFWTRKPDAGFVLTGFPATLLQAKVFDEWLEARDESLNGVFAPVFPSTISMVSEHYRTQGLLLSGVEFVA